MNDFFKILFEKNPVVFLLGVLVMSLGMGFLGTNGAIEAKVVTLTRDVNDIKQEMKGLMQKELPEIRTDIELRKKESEIITSNIEKKLDTIEKKLSKLEEFILRKSR